MERYPERGNGKQHIFIWVLRYSILEAYAEAEGYDHLRLDGMTPTDSRVGIVNQFNKDPSLFLFLISTRW